MELIIVIAILAIIGSGFLTSTNIITNARCKKATESIYTALGNVKTNSLATSRPGDATTESYLMLWRENGGIYMYECRANNLKGMTDAKKAEMIDKQKEKIAPDGLGVKYEDASGTVRDIPSLKSDAIKIYFKRGSGVVDTSKCTHLFKTVTAGNYEVLLVSETGKMKWGRK